MTPVGDDSDAVESAEAVHATPPLTPLLSAAEVADLFAVHPSTIRRMAREARIPAYWVGSTPRFDATEIASAFRTEAQPPPRPPRRKRQPNSDAPARHVDRKRLRSQLYP